VIVVRLMGGLGNQMFQYALGRHVALRRDTGLLLDPTSFRTSRRGETTRHFALGPYRLEAETAAPDRLASFLAGHRGVMALLRASGARPGGLVVERGPSFDATVLDARDDSYLVGYWQSERYFRDVADTIRRELTLEAPPTGANARLFEKIRATESLALHVRRGDYLSNPAASRTHGSLGIGYYERAVEHASSRFPGLEVFVFSDDPAWCRRELRLPVPVTYVDHNSDAEAHEDLRLMAGCRHHVVANSSFSWWGAWLEPSPGGLVVAPRQWFRDEALPDTDVQPTGWTRI
jgi:hypothetical protein